MRLETEIALINKYFHFYQKDSFKSINQLAQNNSRSNSGV
jgi:hypothetical protein